MPEEQATEQFLEVGDPESEGSYAKTFYVLVIVFSILIVGFLVFMRYYTESQASDREAALTNLTDQLNSKEIKANEEKADSVIASTHILTTASKSKYLFKAFIDDLCSKITNDVKLNSLSIDQNGKVVMDGESTSYRSVADLAVGLGSSAKLKNVSITNLSQSVSAETSKTTSKVTFSITAEIKDWKKNAGEADESSPDSESDSGVTVGGL